MNWYINGFTSRDVTKLKTIVVSVLFFFLKKAVPINRCSVLAYNHFFMLLNSLFCLHDFFRAVGAYLLPLKIIHKLGVQFNPIRRFSHEKKWLGGRGRTLRNHKYILISVVPYLTMCVCVLSYGHDTTSDGSRTPWSADVSDDGQRPWNETN